MRSTPTPAPSSTATGTSRGYSIPAQSSADIGADRAKEIALDHAGVSASKATFVRAHLDYEDGRRVYDVEFYSGSKGMTMRSMPPAAIS